MNNVAEDAVDPVKVIVVATLPGVHSDSTQFFWTNGQWRSNENLATKMKPAEARDLINGLSIRLVGPMTRDATYAVRQVYDRPLREVG